MANTHIGDLSFGVSAYTKELDKSKKQIDAYGKAVMKVAKIGKEGHEKVVAALTKREVAMRKAHAAAVKFGAQVAASKASEEAQASILKETNSTLNTYIGIMNKVKTSVHDVDIAQQKFNNGLSKNRDALKAATKKSDVMTDTLRNMESAAVLAIGPLSGVGARIRSLGAIAGRSSLSLVVLIGAAVAMGVALWKMSAAALNAHKVFESSMARFKAATGSLALARAEMGFVIKTSMELGLRIQDTAKAYSRLSAASKGTSLEGAGVRKVFLGIAKASAALRLEQGEVEGAFRAIEQMMSKGSVQAEELRGQLGERLPGAFRLAAEAMNMTTMELGKALKMGEVMAEDFLPKLAKELEKSLGADAANNVNSFTGSMNNLGNRTLLFAKEWDRVTNTSGIFIAAIHLASSAVKGLTTSLEFLVKAFISAGVTMVTFFGGSILAGVIAGFKALRVLIVGNTLAMKILNIVMLANPFGGVISILGKLAVSVIAGTAAFFGLSWALDDNSEALEKESKAALKAQEAHEQLQKDIGDLSVLKGFAKEVDDITRSLDNLQGAQNFGKNAKEVEQFYRAFQNQDEFGSKIASMDEDKRIALAKKLGDVLDREVKPTVEAMASAFSRLTEMEKLWQDGMSNGSAALDALRQAQDEVIVSQQRLAASSKAAVGSDDVKYFDAVTAKVMEYKQSLEFTNMTLSQRVEAEIKMHDALEASYNANKKATDQEKARKDQLKGNEKGVTALAKAEQKLSDLRERLAAAKKGEEDLRYYDKITTAVNAFKASIADVTMSEEERTNILKELEKTLAQNLALEDGIAAARKATAEATKATNQEEAEHMQLVARAVAAIQKADDKLDMMRERLSALRAGPESFEVFTQVTSRVMAFEASLKNAGTPLAEITARVAEFQKLLEDERAFKNIAKLADDMANAMGNSLEDLLTGTQSFKDSLKSLGREFLRIIMRTLVLEPLVKSLSAALGNFMGSSGGGSGGGFAGILTSIISGVAGSYAGGAGAIGSAVSSSAGNATSGFTGLAGSYAGGGLAAANRSYLVGEEGPEILRMGSGSGRVIPNDQIGNMNNNASGDVTINVDAREQENPGRILALIPLITEQVETSIALKMRRGYF